MVGNAPVSLCVIMCPLTVQYYAKPAAGGGGDEKGGGEGGEVQHSGKRTKGSTKDQRMNIHEKERLTF